MTEKFRDTFKTLRANNKEDSIGTASVDLREQRDSYIVRLNLPGRDLANVEISLEGHAVHIVAPAEAKVSRYEQSIILTGAASDAKLAIDRNQKDSLIVVTVPKVSSAIGVDGSSAASPLPLTDWDHEIFDQMEKMQKDMDSVFDNSFRQFQNEPGFHGLFDEPRFGSTIDLKDEGNDYVVKAYLPKRDMQNVSVTLTNQTLKIEAKAQQTKSDPRGQQGSTVAEEAQYSQVITIPGRVQADKMKVDKKEGMLVVTLPKARLK